MYMRNIVWNISFIKFHRNIDIYIYEEHRVEYPNCIWHFEENPKINSTKSHIYIYEEYRVEYGFLQEAETLIILEASGLQKAETFTMLHSPMFAKSLQKSSKHVQPRNSSVEYQKCYFESLRSPGSSCLKACSCHVGGWLL